MPHSLAGTLRDGGNPEWMEEMTGTRVAYKRLLIRPTVDIINTIMRRGEPLSSDENPEPPMVGGRGELKNREPEASALAPNSELYQTRTEEAEARTQQAEARTVQAEARTQQAEFRTEQAIGASELRYRRLFEATKDGII